jgi:hypothetical protein
MSSESVLEFRSAGDDAWYSARVGLEGEVLRVKYLGFSEDDDEVFRASDFKSRREVDEFKDRFRAVSVQVQDSDCSEVVTGDRVCASFSFHDNDVRFYDALVDGVLTPHSKKCLLLSLSFKPTLYSIRKRVCWDCFRRWSVVNMLRNKEEKSVHASSSFPGYMDQMLRT